MNHVEEVHISGAFGIQLLYPPNTRIPIVGWIEQLETPFQTGVKLGQKAYDEIKYGGLENLSTHRSIQRRSF